jgi:phytoene dehydrogenase-like protein
MPDAVVVGCGPNGLTAAVVLAHHGIAVTVLEAAEQIGGGTRSGELTLPGLLHDHCSAFHPLGAGSPAFRALSLKQHGLTWAWADIELAHPFDDGSAAVLLRSLDRTCAALGSDGPAWHQLFDRLVCAFDDLATAVLRPLVRTPHHLPVLVRFGLRGMQPAGLVVRRWRTDAARALFAGVAAHAMRPLHAPFTGAFGLLLTAAAHHHGWPVAVGGSRAISDALASALVASGGLIETGRPVRSLVDVPSAELVLYDLTPDAVLRIVGDRLPAHVQRAFRSWRYGPGVVKLDLAVEGGIPWTNEACRRAGTVHLGGTFGEVAAALCDVTRGRMPSRPFVLVGQQYLADPSRSVGNVHPVWVYAHVPNGYSADATEAVLAQLERFAPGARERIVATSVRSPAELARYNPNYAGGDIAAGANTARQLVLRPRLALDPYSLGVPGHYLCSAATPPGAGVHGMCGYHAARSALAWLDRRR